MTPSHFWESNCIAIPSNSLLFPLEIFFEDLTDLKAGSSHVVWKEYAPCSTFHVWRSTCLSFNVISSSRAFPSSPWQPPLQPILSFYFTFYLLFLSTVCLQHGLLGYHHHRHVGKGKGNNNAIAINVAPKQMWGLCRNLSTRYYYYLSYLYNILTQAKEHLPSAYLPIDCLWIAVCQ